jgi:hypothetical protein
LHGKQDFTRSIRDRMVRKYQQFIHGGKPAMPIEPAPRIGDWYRNSSGESFEIVAQDEEDETLELQYYDGTLEELDRETWESMRPQPIEPPEDWLGPMDLAREDSQDFEVWSETDDWLSELDRLDKSQG